MHLDQAPLRGPETDTLALAGKVASAALGMLWKGSLAVLATAVVVGGFGRPGGSTAGREGVGLQQINVDEQDNGFIYLRLRRGSTDRPTHLVFKSPAGKPIATLTFNHLTESLCFAYAELGSVRAASWIKPDRSVGTSVLTPRGRVRAQLDTGLDESLGMRAWDIRYGDHELGRVWIPPVPARTNPPEPDPAPSDPCPATEADAKEVGVSK
jgi:hypothetical protein